MTPAEYKALRQQLGSLRKAAAILGVRHTTLDRRERGQAPIDTEAELAIRHALSTSNPAKERPMTSTCSQIVVGHAVIKGELATVTVNPERLCGKPREDAIHAAGSPTFGIRDSINGRTPHQFRGAKPNPSQDWTEGERLEVVAYRSAALIKRMQAPGQWPSLKDLIDIHEEIFYLATMSAGFLEANRDRVIGAKPWARV
jgi:hypothetical protein